MEDEEDEKSNNEDTSQSNDDQEVVVSEAKRRRKSPPVQIKQHKGNDSSFEDSKPFKGGLSLKSPLDLESRNNVARESVSPPVSSSGAKEPEQNGDMASSIQAALAALQAGQSSLNQLSMQLMALGANSGPGLWQSQLAAVAARQLTNAQHGNENRPSSGPSLPPPPPLASLQQPQISPNEIQAIQQALQQQQQNIQQHLQNLLLLQQSASSLGNIAAASGNNNLPPNFMGNQVNTIKLSYY